MAAETGTAHAMPYDDDDDWSGTPPEGRHTRDQADPGHWNRQKPMLAIGSGVLALVVIVLLVVALVG